MSSANLVDAFERLLRYEELLDSGVTEIVFRKDGDEYMIAESYPNPADYQGKLGCDTSFAAIVVLCRIATGRPIYATRAEFIMDEDDPLYIYEDVVSGRVTRSTERNALFFKASDIEAPLPGAQPDVAAATSQIAEKYIRSMDKSRVSNRVREALISLLPSGSASQEQVAQLLFCSTSTLQRQLQAEGSSFRDISEQTRRTLAESYLKDTDHSQAQIAFLTGFGDQSNFARAFKKWTGMSPGAFRREA